MFHAEPLCKNPITGRRAWLLRHIHQGTYGHPWDVSLVVIRRRYFGRTAVMLGAEKVSDLALVKELRGCLAQMGFHNAVAMRHGREKSYNVKVRSRGYE